MEVSNTGFKNPFTRMLSGNVDPDDQKHDQLITLSAEKEAEKRMGPKQEECYFYPSLESDIKFKMQSLCNDSTNKSLCDATIEIGKNRQIFHIVSALFAVHSTELDDLLKSNRNKLISFEDLTPDCFQFLRLYFYGLNPVIPLQLVSDILYAANKLKINPLADAVVQYIKSLTDIDDLVLVLSLLHQHSFHELINTLISMNNLFEDSGRVFYSDNLNLLSPALMIRFLESAQFQTGCILSEEEIFEKCVCWAKYNAKIYEINRMNGTSMEDLGKIPHAHQLSTEWKRIIKPLLPYIRFPNMKGEFSRFSLFILSYIC